MTFREAQLALSAGLWVHFEVSGRMQMGHILHLQRNELEMRYEAIVHWEALDAAWRDVFDLHMLTLVARDIPIPPIEATVQMTTGTALVRGKRRMRI